MEEILTAEIAKIAKREMRNWLLCALCGSSHSGHIRSEFHAFHFSFVGPYLEKVGRSVPTFATHVAESLGWSLDCGNENK
jgi:hypothetical protein